MKLFKYKLCNKDQNKPDSWSIQLLFFERTAQDSAYFIDKEEDYNRLAGKGKKQKEDFTTVHLKSRGILLPPRARVRTLL
jgi:hypothetical protein